MPDTVTTWIYTIRTFDRMTMRNRLGVNNSYQKLAYTARAICRLLTRREEKKEGSCSNPPRIFFLSRGSARAKELYNPRKPRGHCNIVNTALLLIRRPSDVRSIFSAIAAGLRCSLMRWSLVHENLDGLPEAAEKATLCMTPAICGLRRSSCRQTRLLLLPRAEEELFGTSGRVV